MAETVTVKGLADLNRLLQDLPAKVEANVLRGGMRAGAKVIADEAKRLCPESAPGSVARKIGATTGELRRSIRVSMRSRRGLVQAFIKAGSKKAFYAHLVEHGTASHWIKPKSRKSLVIARLFKEAVLHPGARRQPFMRPALDTRSQAAIEAMADYMRARLPKEFAKVKT